MTFHPSVFAQLMQLLDHDELKRCIDRYEGNSRVKTFSCLDQFLCMAFGQLAQKKSMRVTVFSLQQMRHKLYHMGIRGRVSLSALSDANNHRKWGIWEEYAQSLITRAKVFYRDEAIRVDEEIATAVYAFDSSTVDLCLSVFPWANFRSTKAGIKLHTQLDLRGFIPVYIDITEALGNDMKALDKLNPEPGSIWLFDRGYLDFGRLYKFTRIGAFFVTRTKHNTKLKRVYSRPVDRNTGLVCDQVVVLALKKARKTIPKSCAA